MLYVWVTNNIKRRICEHKNKINECFTSKYNINKLIYLEKHKYVLNAIRREKQIKWRTRKKKEILINQTNPLRNNLSSLIHFDSSFD